MRIKHIDALRGIAAILVTFFHLSRSSGLSINSASYGKYGYLGVEIFFVISGFILPYSMSKTGYTTANIGDFILKRVIRIYPAYIITIIIGILLPLLTGRVVVSGLAISAHLMFLNSILGYDWISPVFWTLAIEFQFYILIGLLYSYFSSSNIKSLVLIYLMTVCSLIFNNQAYIFHWFPFFALGILIYKKMFNGLPSTVFWGSGLVFVLAIIYLIGWPEAIAACFAFLFILFIKMERDTKFNKAILWLGQSVIHYI